jgi:hypothetical protein
MDNARVCRLVMVIIVLYLVFLFIVSIVLGG